MVGEIATFLGINAGVLAAIVAVVFGLSKLLGLDKPEKKKKYKKLLPVFSLILAIVASAIFNWGDWPNAIKSLFGYWLAASGTWGVAKTWLLPAKAVLDQVKTEENAKTCT